MTRRALMTRTQQPDGAEQSRGQQRGVARKLADVVFGEPRRLGQELVAYQPVGPEVRHLDFQLVSRRFKHRRDLYPERLRTQHPQINAVQAHSRTLPRSR